jgi:hypothetical protein
VKTFSSLNMAIFDLRKRGYRLDFSFNSRYIKCAHQNLKINLSEIEIDEAYKFPSINQPGKQNILCALKTNEGHRGILYDCSDRIFKLFEIVRPKILSANSTRSRHRRRHSQSSSGMILSGR